MSRYYYLTSLFGLSAIILIMSFSLFYVRLAEVEHLLIVHFESLGGVDFLGSQYQVLGILVSGFFLLFSNFIMAVSLYNRQRSFSYLLGLITVFLSVLILLTITVIISVN